MRYIFDVLVAIDQLGNTLAGGHHDTSISARVGYFSRNAKRGLAYWRFLETVINFAFNPIQGPDHCYFAYLDDPEELFKQGSDIARIVLSIFIFIACPIIAIILSTLTFLIPPLRWDGKPFREKTD